MATSRRKTRQRRQAGFTLIELMVVIVIIGLLVALVGPQLMGAADDAKVVAARAQISNLKSALNMYKLNPKLGKYPSTGEGLNALVNNPVKNFLESEFIPKDPWKNDYVYTSPGAQGHDFEIVSYGEGGALGGEGYAEDITSWNLQANQ